MRYSQSGVATVRLDEFVGGKHMLAHHKDTHSICSCILALNPCQMRNKANSQGKQIMKKKQPRNEYAENEQKKKKRKKKENGRR